MAESKNTFLKSKMNKDLDDRLMPPGEYRDARNISISRSEDADVGAIENVLGNELISNFANSCGAEVIGRYMDVTGDRIFVMLTNYTDNSATKLDNFSPSGALHYICSYNVTTAVIDVLVEGYFLNFSKTHPINHINLLEDLLFWTDNRNQPRKINVNIAAANNSYYTTEDHVSVAKYYPFQPIKLMKLNTEDYPTNVLEGTMKNRTDEYLPNESQISVVLPDPQPVVNWNRYQDDPAQDGYLAVGYHTNLFTTTTSLNGEDLSVNVLVKNNASGAFHYIDSVEINYPGNGQYVNNDLLRILPPDETTPDPVLGFNAAQIEFKDAGVGATPNPNAISDWTGDPNFLKDKFVRFSYRFKFEDSEYSLMAPFTQQAFIPEQDGYFVDGDEDKTFKSTEVSFFRNKVDDILLMIPAPSEFAWKPTPIFTPGGPVVIKGIYSALKVSEVDILMKESEGLAVKVIETIPRKVFQNADNLTSHNSFFEYNYKSQKAYKTLPEKDTVRVYDKTPVRAATQEVSGNRIIYGNYINKHTPPLTIDYNTLATEKTGDSIIPLIGPREDSIIEYPNHTLKQNRTYQIGIVLSDRYGRQSSVILSTQDSVPYSPLNIFTGSSLFHYYKDNSIIDPSNVNPILRTWPGDSLKILFNSQITSTRNINNGTPGLYDGESNPLGWYSFKVVVKQQEQDYYNVYFPGILNGSIFVTTTESTALPATPTDPTCYITLQGDNINKIPRDLKNVGPDQKIFRTNKPTKTENPLWYAVVDVMGNTKVAHFDNWDSPEAKAFIQTRNVELGLIEPKEVENASVELYPRVENIRNIVTGYENRQITPGLEGDVVTTIGTGVDLGLYPSTGATFPVEFYNPQSNPLYAKLQVQDYTIGISGDGAKLVDPYAPKLPILSIYETEPEYSRLKLFWETTTSGLIEELNSDILEADELGVEPSDIGNWDDGWVLSKLNYESTPAYGEVTWLNYDNASGIWSDPPTEYNCRLSHNFWIIDSNGNKVTTNVSISIDTVKNGNGVLIQNKFDIKEDVYNPGEFFIYLTKHHWFNENAGNNDFNFNLIAVHQNSTAGFVKMGFIRNIPPFGGYLDIKNMPTNTPNIGMQTWGSFISNTSCYDFSFGNCFQVSFYDWCLNMNCTRECNLLCSPPPVTDTNLAPGSSYAQEVGGGDGDEGIAYLWANIYNPITPQGTGGVGSNISYNNSVRSEYIFSNNKYRITGGNSLSDPEERWFFRQADDQMLSFKVDFPIHWFCLPAFNGSYLNNSFNDDAWNVDNFPRLHQELEIVIINQKRIESQGLPDSTNVNMFYIKSNYKSNHNPWTNRVNGQYVKPTSGNPTYPYTWLMSKIEETTDQFYPDDLFEIEVEWRDANNGSGHLSSTATFYCKMVHHPSIYIT